MNIQIQSIHFSANDKLKLFINKRVDKLIDIDDSILSATVFLKIDKPGSYDNKIVEIKLHAPNSEYFAKKQSNSFEESTDLVSQALRKQILKNKEK
tara:strand:+ start:5141 stop:5428 length:288 start_codon:yes stop_codon:yes gene_type:complete